MIRGSKIRGFVFTAVGLLAVAALVRADVPKPSPFPISWELKFDHATPRRIVVKVPGENNPRAFWYMTFTVTNNSGQERQFYPNFELLTSEGSVIRSGKGVPPSALKAIKSQEPSQFLKSAEEIGGMLRQGEDQAKEGVCVWPEPADNNTAMGRFTIFVTGLSGESTTVKRPDGKDEIIRKTLQLDYHVNGDLAATGEVTVVEDSTEWVMR